MKRRKFMTLMGAGLSWPLVVRARQTRNIPLVGVLMSGAEAAPDSQKRIAAFLQGFADQGWKDGDNVRIEIRWSAGKEALIRQYAGELVALAPDIILANSTPVVMEFQRRAAPIPIVFALAIDPVGLGQVKSLAHPGGNFTGFTFVDPPLIGKWIELLKEVAPRIVRVAVLFDPATSPFYNNFVSEVGAGRPDGIDITAMPVGSPAEMESGIKALAGQPDSGLLFGPDPFNQVHIKQIARLAAENRLPTVSVYRPFVTEGGLMSYGPDTSDVFRRSAAYVDRILKGAKPADLPVQQPNKFEMILNAKTAKGIGVQFPPTLLALADEVIE